MPAESTHGDIHAGDVTGTFIVGDNNHVTNTTRHPEQAQAQAQAEQPEPHQQNSAEDRAALFALERGTMHVTYNAYHPEAGQETER
ncbi:MULTISPECIES: hypothetical protein [unclassified Streptomyces]|uniref:hypothetical protein n=1 Tax=unclassified Streptomyces TaxID=2593676 RepID=UPI002024C185|nr:MULTISPECIES: hypothetical protein [unclassified Streptomyces]MCX4549195.1 hypothetical protein [Streptomyces sp. NBC_01500]WSC20766.1 hypothetical protein OIE60_14290 [Streptomyces sp. NBC_01766]WSV54793.1 hypothetical protein OG282_14335 [Streptomyces sp. NBC_01014]